jgi:hypothetical protein
MTDLSGILGQVLAGNTLGQLSGAIGANKDQTAKAVSAAMPVLLEALTRNASSGTGAASLLSALDRDHDGSILDDLAGYLGGGAAGGLAGDAILGHVLGDRRGGVENGISRASGLDAASVAKLLMLLAPIVMGALGKAQRGGGLDAGGLASMLGAQQKKAQQAAPDAFGALSKMLDADGDGSALDEVTELGTGLLGSLFKR